MDILFLLFLGLFLLAFLIEALVLYFFKLTRFWAGFGLAIALNLISFALIYFVAFPILGLMGYDLGKLNGLNPPAQVTAFFWWFSVVVEGLLLTLFLRRQQRSKIFLASTIMNWLSFLFLYLFIINSH